MRGPLEDGIARVTGLVAALGRPYAVIGGVAMVLRVRPRPTLDLDLVIAAESSDVDDILHRAAARGYSLVQNPMARELADEGLVQLDGPDGFGVDLIFADSPFLERVISRARHVDGSPFDLLVATVEDLLLLKLEAGRGIDTDDAIAIKDAFEEHLDRGYLALEADRLGVRERLENLIGPLPVRP